MNSIFAFSYCVFVAQAFQTFEAGRGAFQAVAALREIGFRIPEFFRKRVRFERFQSRSFHFQFRLQFMNGGLNGCVFLLILCRVDLREDFTLADVVAFIHVQLENAPVDDADDFHGKFRGDFAVRVNHVFDFNEKQGCDSRKQQKGKGDSDGRKNVQLCPEIMLVLKFHVHHDLASSFSVLPPGSRCSFSCMA